MTMGLTPAAAVVIKILVQLGTAQPFGAYLYHENTLPVSSYTTLDPRVVLDN